MAFISDFATGLRVIGGAARSLLSDSSGNDVTRKAMDQAGNNDAFVPIGGINDDVYLPARMDRLGSLAIASNTLLFTESFEGSTLASPNRLSVAQTTFAAAQLPQTGLRLNSAASLASAAASLVVTNRRFTRTQRAPLHAKFRARLQWVANAVIELGFGNNASQTASPTTGAYLQITSSGVIQGVWTYNSTDVTTPAFSLPTGWETKYWTVDVFMDDDEINFAIQDTSTGYYSRQKIKLPNTGPRLWDATRLPVFGRLHNVSATATASDLAITAIDVILLDSQINRPWSHTAPLMGLGSEIHPTTFAQNANWANSTVPTSATLSNTAAGYTTLGGLFQFAAVAGAATDFALFGYTLTVPYSFVCTGVDIDSWNTGAAGATTRTLLNWFVAPDSLAISLATATNRRVPLGSQSFRIGAEIGERADVSISRDFTHSPLVTNPARLFVIGLRVPVGTATASQVIQGMVTVKGYFE